MKPADPHRIAQRLQKLRARFGRGVRERNLDHDQEHLTSTRREHVPERTFFLGEIWWAERFALGDHRPHRASSSHLPALVTRREAQPHAAIEIAPASLRTPEDTGALCFRPIAPPEGLDAATVFLLAYRQPMERENIGAPMGRLAGRDVQNLAGALDAARRKRETSA